MSQTAIRPDSNSNSNSNSNSDSEYEDEDEDDSDSEYEDEEEKQVIRKLREEAFSLHRAILDAQEALYLQNAAIHDPTQTPVHNANVRDKGKCVQKKGRELCLALNGMFLVCYEIQYDNSPDRIRSAIEKEIEAARILGEVNRGFINEYNEYLGMFVVCDAWDDYFNKENTV